MTTAKKKKSEALPVWPARKKIPAFLDEKEEARFWDSYDFGELLEKGPVFELEPGGPGVPVGRASRTKRNVLPVRLDDEELARLKAAARKSGGTVAEVIRSYARSLPSPRRVKAKAKPKK